MKKFLLLALSAAVAATVTACGPAPGAPSATAAEPETPALSEAGQEPPASPDTVIIPTLGAEQENIQLEVPYNPQRVAVLDMAALDMLDTFGFGDRVVGVSKGSSIPYLQKYMTDDSLINLGTIKEASLEAVMECDPEIIFIGGRLASQYEAFSEIAPVIYLATDTEIGLVNSVTQNAMTVASIFGAQGQVSGLLADYGARIEALAAIADGSTAFVGMLNAGGFNVLGNDGRCSIIGVEVGFENIGLAAESSGRTGGSSGITTATHGNETSFEYIVRLDPDYIFVMNRDDAIGTEGAQAAKEVIENELVMKTSAYQNGRIVYLQHSNIWYTAEGGITALGYMIQDLEDALLADR